MSAESADYEAYAVFNHLSHTFCDDSQVNVETLLTAMFYLEKWFLKSASGADATLLALLEKEQITEDTIQQLRQYLVSFAAKTQSLPLLAQSIDVLHLFHDPRLVPLFDTWLLQHIQKANEHWRVIHSLTLTLQDSGETVSDRRSSSTLDVNETLSDCRTYLHRKFGIHLPW